jgi:hypothetical protein
VSSLLRLLPSLVLAGVVGLGCEARSREDVCLEPNIPTHASRYPPKETPPPSPLPSPPSGGRGVGEGGGEGPAAALPMPAPVPSPNPHPLRILAISGGVAGAPFTAGVLVGWTRCGTRPLFDEVTGISSGALIGAYAFLGPKYDAEMQRLILSLNTADLIRFRPLCCMLRDGAFGSAKPAERLILRAFNDCFVADLARAHLEGRRFYVGTMNLQTRRLEIWDIGALASSGRPDAADLVRRVLLAAISWPGAVPPVEFVMARDGHCWREQHCDAGSVAMAFLPCGPHPTWPAGSDLYVLASRKLYSEPMAVPKSAFCRLKPSVSAIFEALTRADIARLYSTCALTGLRFHVLAVPPDFHGEGPSIANLYPKEARQLFETGCRLGAGGPCWRLTPPGAEPGEEAIPRDGSEIQSCR